jgi:hypothetical protein
MITRGTTKPSALRVWRAAAHFSDLTMRAADGDIAVNPGKPEPSTTLPF